MKAFATFFKDLTFAKKVLLALTPIISMIISIKMALLGLFLLIGLDLVTGIRKTLHQKKIKCNPFKSTFWRNIKSYLLRQTWRKTYEYGIGILVLMVFESMIFGETVINLADKSFTITELAILLPAAIEVWSIFENLESVSGKNILKRLKTLLPQPLRKLLSSENENK